MNHTKGPWFFDRSNFHTGPIVSNENGNHEICEVYSSGDEDEIATANVNLICAAPTMYAALSDLRRYLAQDNIVPKSITLQLLISNANHALKKAKGKS